MADDFSREVSVALAVAGSLMTAWSSTAALWCDRLNGTTIIRSEDLPGNSFGAIAAIGLAAWSGGDQRAARGAESEFTLAPSETPGHRFSSFKTILASGTPASARCA